MNARAKSALIIPDSARFEEIFQKHAAFPGSEQKTTEFLPSGVINFLLAMNGGMLAEAGSGRFAAV